MSKIAIRPYFENSPNMGLEKYKQVLFQGTAHTQEMWAKEDVPGSNIFRFITGLNELAPEVVNLPDEEKQAKITEIRNKIAYIEGILVSNKLDPKDKPVWDKVKMLKPDNIGFWGTIKVAAGNDPIYLDAKDPSDLIKITSIEAGGYPDIASSLEQAKKSPKKPKFYLDRENITAVSVTKSTISEARAKALLVQMYDENINKLRFVCKAVDANSTQYKKSTPNEVMFGNMSEFIDGKMEGTPKKECAAIFLRKAELDMETLKLQALAKDSSFYRILAVRNGQIYEGNTDTALGYNIADVVEFLKNPLNDAVLERLLSQIEKYWNE